MKKLIFFSFVYCLNLGCVGPEAVPNLGRDIGAGFADAIKSGVQAGIQAGVQNASNSNPSVVISQGGGGFALNGFSALGLVVGTAIVTYYAVKKFHIGPDDTIRRDEFDRFLQSYSTSSQAIRSDLERNERVLGECRTLLTDVKIQRGEVPAKIQEALRRTGVVENGDAMRAALDGLPNMVETAVERAMAKSGVRDAIVGLKAEMDSNSSRVRELQMTALSTLDRLHGLQGTIDTHAAKLEVHATKMESTQFALHGLQGLMHGINGSILVINQKLGAFPQS